MAEATAQAIAATGLKAVTTSSSPTLTTTNAAPVLPLCRLPTTAAIAPIRSEERGHFNQGWLDTYHSFPVSDWHRSRSSSHPEQFGALRILNEDTVQPLSGFPTHPHRDFEIFTYVLSGELTHRDSHVPRGYNGTQSNQKTKKTQNDGGNDDNDDDDSVSPDQFVRIRRGDLQFTTGGTGIAHSENNEHASEAVHFLQIWAVPWKRGLPPRYHTGHFPDAAKRQVSLTSGDGQFVPILSPLAAGPDATAAEEAEAVPALPGTIPVHADLVMGAALVGRGKTAVWTVGLAGNKRAGAGGVTRARQRKVFVHLPATGPTGGKEETAKERGKARIRLDGRDDAVLNEGDGAFVDLVAAGDMLTIESIGTGEAEVVVLDTA